MLVILSQLAAAADVSEVILTDANQDCLTSILPQAFIS